MTDHIVAFDLETTGLDKNKDSIIQIALIKFNVSTHKIVDKYSTYVKPVNSYSISIQAYMKHGIKPEFLNDKPTFGEIANDVIEFIKGCDILSYNGTNFDVPFLKNEFERVGIDWNVLDLKFYDAFLEEKRRNGNKLEETYKRYYNKTMEESGFQAHDAFSDVMATIGIFFAQQKNEKYDSFTPLTEDNVISLQNFKGEMKPLFNIGKYKELPIDFVAGVDRSYLEWCISDKSSFCKSTKEYIKKFII